MKVDLDRVLLSLDGQPLKSDKDEDATLGYVLSLACLNADPRKHDTGEKKYEIYQVAKKVTEDGIVDLSHEDIVLLKKLVGEVSPVAVVGTVWDILDGEDEEEDDGKEGEDPAG